MRLLVIGATGFIGAHVAAAAEALGMTVTTAARTAPPGRAGHHPRHHRTDLAGDPALIRYLLADTAPQVVVNCAGAVAGPIDTLTTVNVTGTWALVRAMLTTAPAARLVHLGSAAEYGIGVPGVRVDEHAPARPVGGYGATKLAGTRLVELACAAGLDAVVLRVFNPVGPGAPTTGLPGGLAAQLRAAMNGDGEIRLGRLDAVRDFVDVRDVAGAALAAATATSLPHRVLNIGSGVGRPVRELVKELVGISGYRGPVHEDATGSARSANVSWQCADIALAAGDLGWRPHRTFTESLTDLWSA